MKKLLLSAMILCGVHSNAMENLAEAHTQRVEQLHQFYLCEAAKTPVLREINLAATPLERKAFLAELVSKNSDIGDNAAMFLLIRHAVGKIIRSPYYYSASPSYYAVEALDPIARSYLAASRQEMVQ